MTEGGTVAAATDEDVVGSSRVRELEPWSAISNGFGRKIKAMEM